MQQHKRTVEPNGTNCRRSNSPAMVSSKFFKIILPSIIHEKKLRIPEKFVRMYGDELSAVAMLTIPTGHVSHVGLEKTGKMFWFCDGWQQFMEHHSVSYGYLLVFKYKRNSSFDVLIFDLTATEIQYSCSIHRSSEEPNNGKQCQLSDEEEIEDDDSVEILGTSGFVGSSSKFNLGLTKKGKSAALLESLEPTPCYLTRSKRYKKDQEQTNELENLHGACGRKPSRSEMSNWHDSLFDKSKRKNQLEPTPRYLTRSKRYKKDQEQTNELENLNGACGRKPSRSEMSNWHDSLFDKSMRKNQFVTKNVENLQTLAQPVRDRGFDPLNESELKEKTYRIDVEEQHPTKNANSSQVATQKSRHTSHRFDSKTTNQRTISNGQESMVKQEWCAEMLGTNTRSTTCSTRRPVINQARERAINAARMFKPENPSHMFILRSYNVNNHVLYIPSEFATKMRYLLGVSDFVKLQVSDGKEWCVSCFHEKGGTYLRKGWTAFVKENNLEGGDICVFELTKDKDFLLKVSIFRSSSEEPYNGKQCQLSDGEEIEDDDSVKISGSSGFVGSSSKFSLELNKKGKSAALLESLEPSSRYLTRSKRYKKDQEQTIELENFLGACGRKPSRSKMPNWHDSLFDKSKRKNQFVTKNVEHLQTPAQPVRDRGFDRLIDSEHKDKTYRIDVEEQDPTKNENSSQAATQKNRYTSHRFDSKATNQRTISNGQESMVKQEWCAEMLGPNTRSTNCSTRRPVINQARERAINAARLFKPENPSHMFILRSYNVNNHVLYIPSEFATKMRYLLGVSDFVKLQVSDGKEWCVSCFHEKGGTYLRKGWTAFLKENNLEEGDICVFELTKDKDFVLKVSIFRSSSEEPYNGKQCQLSDGVEIEYDDSVEILGTSGFVGSSSKFNLGLNKKGKSAALLESLEPSSRYLTRSKRYKKDQEQTIELENFLGPCGRKPSRSEMSNWHDSLFDKSKRKNQFVTKNVEHLQTPAQPVRDRGFDRLIDSEHKDKTYRIDVEEQDPTKNENSSQAATQKNRHTSHRFDSKATNQRTISNGQESMVKQEWCAEMLGPNTRSTTCSTRRPVINQARERAINAARMFKPENPSHMFILRSYNVNNHVLYIPSEFATKMRYLLGVSDFVKLQVSDGKEWCVSCFHEKGGTYLRKGWTAFVKENNLEEGDICVFELTKDKDFLLKVSIFRSSSEEPYNGKQCQLSDGEEIEDDDSVKISGSSGFVGSSSKFSLELNKKGKSAALLESLEPSSRYLTRSKRYKKDPEQTIELENFLGACERKPSGSEMPNWHDSLFDKSMRKNQFVTKNVEHLQTPAQPVCDRGFDLLIESEHKDKTYRIDIEEQDPTKNASSSQAATQKNRHTSHQFDSKTTNQRTISIGKESLVKQEWCAEMLGPHTRSTTCLTRRPVINQARERAINAARMFKPENPFHMVILRSYHVNHQYTLYIPPEFAMKMKYLLGVSDMVKLQVSDGREWRVRCIPQNRGIKFSKGWVAFVKENSLVEGDICVFELIKLEDFVMKVSIFRTVGYAGQANQPLKWNPSD